MKKRTKTTDSVLKDIFDPLHRAEESAEHPLSDLSVQERPAPASNHLETFSPGPENGPLETCEGFETTLDEVREESLLFRAEPAEEAVVETEAVVAPLPAVEIKKAAPRHHQIVKVSVFLVFAGLSAMLGYILYAQNQGIEQNKKLRISDLRGHHRTQINQKTKPEVHHEIIHEK